jgi:hypothetical protein
MALELSEAEKASASGGKLNKENAMAVVYIEARPKGRPDASHIEIDLRRSHRQPDAAGLGEYQAALANGVSRQQVALDVALSPEAEADLSPSVSQGVFAPNATDSQIARLYYGLLDRTPDAFGLADWEASVANGTSLTTVAQDILNSPEYQALNGNPSNSEFLAELYQDALGRAPDAAGFQVWSSALSSGISRASVALGISESPEAQQRLALNIEVGMRLV